MNWILDFDDTLVWGPVTWATCRGIPDFIQEHRLSYEPMQLNEIMLTAQERSDQTSDTAAVLTEFFNALGWPDALKACLLEKMEKEYASELFDDSLAFLRRVHDGGHRVYVVSNNNRAPAQARKLGIVDYIDGIFTPRLCPGTAEKPDQSLWTYLVTHHPEVELSCSVMIGDDPWSDGLFADRCGLACWLIDRQDRFSSRHSQLPYRWIRSLLDIPVVDLP